MQKGHLSLCVSASINIYRSSAKFELEHYPSFRNFKTSALGSNRGPIS